MFRKRRKSLPEIIDFEAYVKIGENYELMSMYDLYREIYDTMIGYINDADLNDNTVSYMYKNENGAILSYTGSPGLTFQAVKNDLPPIINYNTKHWITNKKPFTCVPVWSSRHLRFGHRGCLITKKHMIYQAHSAVPIVGDEILFLDENNQKVFRIVANSISQSWIGIDSGLVELNEDVPENIKPCMFLGYPLLHFLSINPSLVLFCSSHSRTRQALSYPCLHIRASNYENFNLNTTFKDTLYNTAWNNYYGATNTIDKRGLVSYNKIDPNTGQLIIAGTVESEKNKRYDHLTPPSQIWRDRPIGGDSGHVFGYIFRDRYIINGKNDGNINFMNEYEGGIYDRVYPEDSIYFDHINNGYEIPLNMANRIKYQDQINIWQGENAENYRPEYLTKYSV